MCDADQATISGSGCIEDPTAFNESQDTVPITPSPFDRPGPADPTQCNAARNNNVTIGSVCEGPNPNKGCGLGFELVFLLPAVLWLDRRRRLLRG